MAQNTTNRRSAIDGRVTRHPGYAVSQQIRKRIERAHSWMNRFRRLLVRWEWKVSNYEAVLHFACALFCLRAAKAA